MGKTKEAQAMAPSLVVKRTVPRKAPRGTTNLLTPVDQTVRRKGLPRTAVTMTPILMVMVSILSV